MGIYRFERAELNGKDINVRRKRHDINFYTHWHEYYEIMFYKDCEGLCVMNGVNYKIENSCLFFLTPADFHRIESRDKEGAYSINISFSENIIDSMITKKADISPRVLQVPSAYISETVYKIYEIFTNKPDSISREIELRCLLNFLLINVLCSGEKVMTNNPCIHPAIRNAILYMVTDISKPYTLSEIADKCGLTPAYFSAMFHQEVGKTFKKWQTDTRIEHAKRLLENTDSSILNICFECGFGSLSHFIRIFRQSTGITPNAYRMEKQLAVQETQ